MQCDYCARQGCGCCDTVFQAELGMCERFSARSLSERDELLFMRGPYKRPEE